MSDLVARAVPAESLLHHAEQIGDVGARIDRARSIRREVAAEAVQDRHFGERRAERRRIAERGREHHAGRVQRGRAAVRDGNNARAHGLKCGFDIEQTMPENGIDTGGSEIGCRLEQDVGDLAGGQIRPAVQDQRRRAGNQRRRKRRAVADPEDPIHSTVMSSPGATM